MFSSFAPLFISMFLATGPDKPLWILILQLFDSTMAVFIMVSPEIAIPVNFSVTCPQY
jgi:hypothetical protein